MTMLEGAIFSTGSKTMQILSGCRSFLFSSLVLLFFLHACASAVVSTSDPKFQFVENELYYVSITPILSRDYHYAFRLIIKNKTTQEMEIDWNKTFYIQEEDAVSNFMFDGIPYANREAPIPREKVPANDMLIRTVWPNALVDRKKDWFHLPMEAGKHGMEVTLVVNRKQVFKEKLLLTITVNAE